MNANNEPYRPDMANMIAQGYQRLSVEEARRLLNYKASPRAEFIMYNGQLPDKKGTY